MLARGEAYTAEAPTLWDVDFQTAVAQAELEDRERPGRHAPPGVPRTRGRRRVDRHHPAGTAAGLRGGGRPPRRRPLRGLRSARRCGRRCSTCRCRSSLTPWPSPTRARGLPWSAPSATSPTWCGGGSWACRCGPSSVETAGWSPLRRPGLDERAAELYESELAGRTIRQAQARVVELLAASGELRGEPAADPARRQVLREGRPAPGDRHQPAVVLPDPAAPGRPARARPPAAMAPGLHGGPLRQLGGGTQLGLADQPAAVLRRAVPGLVPARRPG